MRRFTFVSLLSIACLGQRACGVQKGERAKIEPKAGTWKSCRVSFEVKDGVRLEWVVTDKDLIEKIAGKPLRDARIDPEPKRYEVFGAMHLEDGDGERVGLTLFFPLGYFKKAGTYYVTDFNEVKSLFRMAERQPYWKILAGAD
jgi:hypothetical protein